MPPAVPAPAACGGGEDAGTRAARIALLRAQIDDIACAGRGAAAPLAAAVRLAGAVAAPAAAWTLGEPWLDARLPHGLDACGVHEVRPAPPLPGRPAAGDRAAALAFALRLAVRRLAALPQHSPRAILCCATPEGLLDIGALHAAGLAAAGLEPGRLVIVSAANATDALWAMEEGLKSRALALVIGVTGDVGLTPARRLSLAAGAHATSCLLLADARASAIAAVASRWQIAAAPSAPHAFDPAAPGRPAWSIRIARMLGARVPDMAEPVRMEWCDETLRFRLAAGLADRTAGACAPASIPIRRRIGAGRG